MRSRFLLAACAAAALVAVAAGCGGEASSAPKEDPGQVMRTVIEHELAGKRDLTYSMLVSEQRKVVSPRLYRSCSPGAAMQKSDVSVGILGVRDVQIGIPGLGKTKTKAIAYKIDFHDGTDPIVSTGHLIAEDGHWRWTLSANSFDTLKRGACP